LQKGNVDVEEEEISGVTARQNRETAWEHWKNGMLIDVQSLNIWQRFSV